MRLPAAALDRHRRAVACDQVFGELQAAHREHGGAVGGPVARDMGAAKAVLLRGHGALVVGADVQECATAALYLEESAHRNYLAANLGAIKVYTKDEIRRVAEALTSRFVIDKTWVYALEKARLAGALSDLD